MKVYVAGHTGMVGSSIARRLAERDDVNLVTRGRSELDLTSQKSVREFLLKERPDQIYLAAARVGGILANASHPAQFIHDNLAIQTNVIHSAFEAGVGRVLFLGSSCIYPKNAPQPIKESYLLDGKLEPTNEPYAIAKIAGLKMCEAYNREHGTDYRSVMPTNLYGPGDNFHARDSHVLPGLIRRFHAATTSKARSVTVWGTGTPRREFLYVDDFAEACEFVMGLDRKDAYSSTSPTECMLNVGSQEETSISALASTIADSLGFAGEIEFDNNKPDGTPRKRLNVDRLEALGWRAKTRLAPGIRQTYAWFVEALQSGVVRL